MQKYGKLGMIFIFWVGMERLICYNFDILLIILMYRGYREVTNESKDEKTVKE